MFMTSQKHVDHTECRQQIKRQEDAKDTINDGKNCIFTLLAFITFKFKTFQHATCTGEKMTNNLKIHQ